MIAYAARIIVGRYTDLVPPGELGLQIQIHVPGISAVIRSLHMRVIQNVDKVWPVGVDEESECVLRTRPRHDLFPARSAVSPGPKSSPRVAAHIEDRRRVPTRGLHDADICLRQWRALSIDICSLTERRRCRRPLVAAGDVPDVLRAHQDRLRIVEEDEDVIAL